MNIDLCRPDEITQEKLLLEFNFQNVKMPYESYKGDYASVKYYIKIIIVSTVKNAEYIKEFAVVNPHDSSILQKNDEPIYMQVGMKQKMSLSIFFQHKNYNCRGTLKGFITFNYLNINLKFMEVQIVRREIIFGDKKCEPAYVARYELIDGVPNKHEKIPIRFFLKSYNLTPTYPNIDNIFFVKYYLNLVIADDEDNRYFKQKEICLFRLYKERKNIYNQNNPNNYNYINEYGEFYDNDEIFITEPIFEEDFYVENKQIQNYGEQSNNNYNKNEEFYDDLSGIKPILPTNNDNDNYRRNINNNRNNMNNSQNIKRNDYNNDFYEPMMNNNYQNYKKNNINNNYDGFDNMNNNNNYNNINNNINNNNYNNNQFNNNRNNINYNKSNNNKPKNDIIINNNHSNYHSIKTKNSQNSYDENNMYEEDMDYENPNSININNNMNPNSFNNYSNNYKQNNNINNNMSQKQINNQNEVHHSHRSNLMQTRISSEDDFNDIFNSLDTNKNDKNKDDLKKNIFG